jgi:hypothetical protein
VTRKLFLTIKPRENEREKRKRDEIKQGTLNKREGSVQFTTSSA